MPSFDAAARPAMLRSLAGPFVALSHRVVLASGWARRAIALASGAFGALAMAPLDAVPALIVPMTVAVWLIDGADQAAESRPGLRRHFWPSVRSAAGAGWWWGFGYFLAGLWWLGSAFLVEPDKTAWALPLGVIGLPAVAALYPALGFALARALWLPGAARILALSVGLGAAECLRATLFTGFPWNEFGMALGGTLVLAQAASIVGLHGLTLVAIAIAAAPAAVADRASSGDIGHRGSRSGVRAVAPAAAVFALIALFGAWRLSAGDPGSVPGVRLRVVQPNVSQDADFSYANKDAILRRYLALSDRATSARTSGLVDVTDVIWPESPFPFILSRDPQALDAISAALPPNTFLLTGAARMEGKPGSPSMPARYFNSVQVIGKGGTVLDTYDKVHLVPFGEYLPWGALLGKLGLPRFVHIPGGFEPGTHHRLLTVPNLPPVAPAICYEAIFPGEFMPEVAGGARPGVILNVTNDSWFGGTAGPYQHFAQARLRTIEEGLPMIRAADTGISAIVDPYGRIVAQLPLQVEGVLDGPLPKDIEPTFFSRYNRRILSVLFGLMLTWIFVVRYRSARFSSP